MMKQASRPAVSHLPRDQKAAQQKEVDATEQRNRKHPQLPGTDRDRRQDQAAVGEIDSGNRIEGGARGGKPLHQYVPEQQLQQQRNIAQRLDIDGGKPRQQPVRRESCDTDHAAEHCREHDTDQRDAQRVDEADDEGPEIGVLRRVGEPVVGDRHAGLATEKGKARGDPTH
jgi:hypothetical protein